MSMKTAQLSLRFSLILTTLVFSSLSPQQSFAQDPGYALMIEQTPADGGTVDPKTGVHTFGTDKVVELTATSAPGYQFLYWVGDVGDESSPTTTVVVNGPKIIVAVFERTTYTFMADNGEQDEDEDAPPAASAGRGGLSAAPRNFWSGSGGGSAIPRQYSGGSSNGTVRYPTLTEEPIISDVTDDFPVPSGDEFPVPIPEPGTLMLLGGMALLVATKRKLLSTPVKIKTDS